MGFKDFFYFNLQKAILTIFLIIFAPLPFFSLIILGFAPPILFLLVLPALIRNSASFLVIILWLILFIVHVLFAYLLACIIVWIFGKISKKRSIQWILILILLVILVIISFFHIYALGDIGGGTNTANILDLLFKWTRP